MTEDLMDSTAAPVERTQPSQFVRTERPGVMSQFNLQSPRVWLIIACVAAVFAWMIFAHRSHSSSNDVGAIAARQAVPVSAVAAKRGDLNLFINAISTITPFNTVTVKSRVDGELVRVLFKEGQMVKQG
ncbi:MAG TPA: biotin/lipoyl-binding protein, partial [Candidatus Binataceae bacterium]|nr:biotin/lipoyl-binding protein [Candidatus Binataceae bacterium]